MPKTDRGQNSDKPFLNLALAYVLPWTPYDVVTVIDQFGPLDGDGQYMRFDFYTGQSFDFIQLSNFKQRHHFIKVMSLFKEVQTDCDPLSQRPKFD